MKEMTRELTKQIKTKRTKQIHTARKYARKNEVTN